MAGTDVLFGNSVHYGDTLFSSTKRNLAFFTTFYNVKTKSRVIRPDYHDSSLLELTGTYQGVQFHNIGGFDLVITPIFVSKAASKTGNNYIHRFSVLDVNNPKNAVIFSYDAANSDDRTKSFIAKKFDPIVFPAGASYRFNGDMSYDLSVNAVCTNYLMLDN